MGIADLHTHTSMTDGMMDVGALLAYVEQQNTLDVIAITDHDELTAGLMARDLHDRHGYRAQVIVGIEITTQSGHLIGLFLERPIARLQSLEDTLQAIHEQGGIAIVPHPLSWLTFSVGQGSIERVRASTTRGVYFDGIEVANPSLAGRVTREKTIHLNRTQFHLAEIGASDAHFLPVLGSGYTTFEGSTPEELKQAILGRSTTGSAAEVPLSKIGYGAIVQQQVRSLVVQPTKQLSRPIRALFAGEQPK